MHVCIDDASRLAYAEVLPDERAPSVDAFTRRALRWFRQRGIRAERLLTDNGSGYISRRYRALCQELGLRHLPTKPDPDAAALQLPSHSVL